MTTDNKNREHDIAFFNIVTPLHNGSGESLGIVDNPILRERKTQFPLIQASTIKGVLRDEHDPKNPNTSILFGPTPGKGHEHSGAISFGDGMILAFPVRSVKGCFAWTTSPLVLWRFYDQIRFMKMERKFPNFCKLIETIYSGFGNPKICSGEEGKSDENEKFGGRDKLCIDGKIFLEEFQFSCEDSNELTKFADEIGMYIFKNEAKNFLYNDFKKKLVLLDDDVFTYFVTNATDIVPNIRIGNTGTTEDASLRYTEYLPAETIMYSSLVFEGSKKIPSLSGESPLDAKKVRDLLKIPSYVQIGGNETTGKGVVKITLASSLDKIETGEDETTCEVEKDD